MKLYALYVFRWHAAQPIQLAFAMELSSFGYFARRSVGECMRFGARTVCQSTHPGHRQSVDLVTLSELTPNQKPVCHAYTRSNGLAACAISDSEYPTRVAHSLLIRVLEVVAKQVSESKWADIWTDQSSEPAYLQQFLNDYQNPAQVDKLAAVEKTLDEVKDIMHKNIEEILVRGTTLDELARKSSDLSDGAKIFYQQARKQNSCCKRVF